MLSRRLPPRSIRLPGFVEGSRGQSRAGYPQRWVPATLRIADCRRWGPPLDCGGRWARQTPPCATAVSQQWPRPRHCSRTCLACKTAGQALFRWTEIPIDRWTEIPISVPSRADSHPHRSPMRNGFRESIDREGILGRAAPSHPANRVRQKGARPRHCSQSRGTPPAQSRSRRRRIAARIRVNKHRLSRLFA